MFNKNIYILRYERETKGGVDVVCRDVFLGLKNKINSDKEIKLILLHNPGVGFSKENDFYLRDMDFISIYSKLNNHFLRRLNFAYKLAKIVKNNDSIIMCADSESIFIAHLAIKLFGAKLTIFSWMHEVITGGFRTKYIKYADYHLAISTTIYQELQSILNIDKDKVSLIYNPITELHYNIERSTKNLLYIGRLENGQKNITELFTALASVKEDFILHIVGDGPDREMLNEMANNLNLQKKIVWHGWISNPWEYIQDNIKEVLAMVMTSKTEGFCLVLIEAMSLGIYCISSNCPGPIDIIKDDINGELYILGNSDELAAKISNLLNNKDLPLKESIQNSVSCFSLENYTNKLINALNRT